MCGITGWLDWADDLTKQRSTLERMTRTLEKRGPDAHGFWFSTHVAFGHRRLIVIDPDGGAQPMTYASGSSTYALTYNGELYNFQELRQELEKQGHIFRSYSDTEVLLHSYIEWGEQCTQHLNGIFAFAIWDEEQQRLFLGRDHLGVKPLFYAQRGNALIFGSELKALLAHPKVEAEVDGEGLAELFGFGTMYSPGAAVYKDVHELRPGHSLTFTRNSRHIQRYWELRSAHHVDDVETTGEHIRALLEDTVRRQLVSDRPVVSLLSGGLDSSGLVSLAARDFAHEHKTLDTYSMDFIDSARYFESSAMRPSLDTPWIKRVSEYAGTHHRVITLDTPDLIDNLLIPMYAHDLPAMGQMETSLYLLFKEIKNYATVSFSGESADEVFSGYSWFRRAVESNASTIPLRRWASTILRPAIEQRIQLADYIERRTQEVRAETPTLEDEDERTTNIRQHSYQCLTHFLPMLLNRKDRMSMATGLEVRVPFCDYRLVEYVWNIPWEMRNVDNIEKGILRRAFIGRLPNDARMRAKSTYPATENPTYYNAIKQWAQHIVADRQQPVHQLIDPGKVKSVLEKSPSHRSTEESSIMLNSIIQMNEWMKHYNVTVNI